MHARTKTPFVPIVRGLVPLLMLAALTAAPPAAYAEGCEGCSGPTLAYLQQHAGLTLQRRGSGLVGYARDHLLTDAGECTATMTAPPEVTRLSSWLVLRGQGEVWNCPHSRSADTITIEAGRTDSSGWSLKVTSGIKGKGLVAEVKYQVEGGRTGGVAIEEVTRVSKTITPSWCHRVGWKGYFEVGSFLATAEFKFTQRWAWWTKNRKTGAKVHASGDVQMDCGSGTVELERKAPIAGFFYLTQSACQSPECQWVPPKRLNFFPPLPPYLPNPFGDDPEDQPGVVQDDEDPDPGKDLPSSDELGEPPTGPLPDPLADNEGSR